MKQTHRGEETTVTRSRRATPIPPHFAITDDMYVYAAAKGVNRAEAEAMTERFVLYWQATPKNALKTDWEKAWMSWLLGDLADGKFSAGGQPKTSGPSRSSRRPEGGNVDGSNSPDATDHGPFAFAVRRRGNELRDEVDAEDRRVGRAGPAGVPHHQLPRVAVVLTRTVQRESVLGYTIVPSSGSTNNPRNSSSSPNTTPRLSAAGSSRVTLARKPSVKVSNTMKGGNPCVEAATTVCGLHLPSPRITSVASICAIAVALLSRPRCEWVADARVHAPSFA